MNRAASVVWRAYRETRSEDAAAELLAQTFGISPGLAASDVTTTLDRWADAGLLGPVQAETRPRWDGRHGDAFVVAYCSIEGTTFVLLTDSPAVAAELAPRLEGIRIAACQPDVTVAVWSCADDFFAIVAGEEWIATEKGVRAARAVLFQELVRRARPGREWVALLHAAACGIDGRCILFPASSCSGKSTLAAALMASGCTLFSDDFIGVEAESFQIPAMPFALAVRKGSWDVLRGWIPAIDDRAAVESSGEPIKFLPAPQRDRPVAGDAIAMVFSEWAPGAEVSEHSLSTADVLGRLAGSGFWVRHDRVSIGAFLCWLDRLPKSTLRYGGLTEAVARAACRFPAYRSRTSPPVPGGTRLAKARP